MKKTDRRDMAGNEEERKMDERVKQRILSRQKAVRPVIKEERPWRITIEDNSGLRRVTTEGDNRRGWD